MLHLQKNSVVTQVTKAQADLRQTEIAWYTGNYSSLMGQASTLLGFAISQLTTAMPEGAQPSLQFPYFLLVAIVIGLSLFIIIIGSALSVWGPSLSLRGKQGATDLHKAVACLHDYLEPIFWCFIVSWILYFVALILQMWIYHTKSIAAVVTIPMSMLVLLMVYYCFSITHSLRVSDDEAVTGKVDMLAPYEFVGDLDHGLHTGMDITKAREKGGFLPTFESVHPLRSTMR
eukprot:TRINITY_DN60827_c0_g1_i1.p1 TRINITY_DN60827_c0_g1~~TRINITY_DN60827_c0_g1_i1.p1  ORF type:complete len:231 (+),score=27.40 TRINITY_DN60827_c0_g1_i1:47-739(+)